MPTPVDKTLAVHTLGCRLNFFETDGILSVLKEHGYRMAEDGELPSHIIINTCTVTNKADVKNRNTIRSAIKKNPGSQVWVTGCYAQTDKHILEGIPGVSAVIGNSEKSSLAYRILSKTEPQLDQFSYSDVLPDGHTRAYLKIQDGCNRKCSYCKIPQARGSGVSRPENDVLDQVRFLQDSGVGEIILTGVNLGWYRDTNGQKAFVRLLEKILAILDYSRLRISSIEPPDVGHELVELLNHPRFCKFLHVPLQSGSARILRAMRRSYNPTSFRKRLEVAQAKVPGIFLGTDVITGFPGESDEDFADTRSLLADCRIARIHAFPYSVRRNTEAESFGDSIPKMTKKERVIELMAISRKATAQYIQDHTGRSLEGILEQDGVVLTDNYIKGRLSDQGLLGYLKPGQFVDVRVEGLMETGEQSPEPMAKFAITSS